VAELDRLTRSVKDLGHLLERFEKRAVSLISVAESLDTGSAAGRLVITIMTAVSQLEREAIGERTRDALHHMRSNGQRVGNIAYGYRLAADGCHLEPGAARTGRDCEDPASAGTKANIAVDCRRPQRHGPAHAPGHCVAARTHRADSGLRGPGQGAFRSGSTSLKPAMFRGTLGLSEAISVSGHRTSRLLHRRLIVGNLAGVKLG
jgi:resolvase-like protein